MWQCEIFHRYLFILTVGRFTNVCPASDIISLLRILFDLPNWKDKLKEYAVKNLSALPTLLAEFSKNKTISDKRWLQKMHTIISIFSILGIAPRCYVTNYRFYNIRRKP